ncbi:Monocyte to macrophage differentiation factor 2 [Chionoecetes opilio]|uniref:Monocyte to macrophage differentiation factor 2 n=1 Tax=Chionoecetes opilio TaxID=41210 RepID=A0A8J5D187_CHIOP|nr:Monocyte to macrophage differentiation factor 2 [Chionoecetes opilio]
MRAVPPVHPHTQKARLLLTRIADSATDVTSISLSQAQAFTYRRLWSSPLLGMAWKNCVAVGRAAYQPTSVEHWANMVTHGLFVLPAVYGAVFMATAAHSSLHTLAATVYGLGLAGLFSVSTFFHIVFYLGDYKNLKEVLHRGDRAMIYVFIATSYTPWLLLRPLPLDSWTLHLRWGIWVLAVVGILYQQVFHERFKMLETVFYLVIGIMPSMAVVDMDDHSGLAELKLGGAIYVMGVVFFKLDGRVPLAHAIWHLFVVLASFIHYYAVLTYLIMPQANTEGGEDGPHGGEQCDASASLECPIL